MALHFYQNIFVVASKSYINYDLINIVISKTNCCLCGILPTLASLTVILFSSFMQCQARISCINFKTSFIKKADVRSANLIAQLEN